MYLAILRVIWRRGGITAILLLLLSLLMLPILIMSLVLWLVIQSPTPDPTAASLQQEMFSPCVSSCDGAGGAGGQHFSSNNDHIAAEAIALQDHITGISANVYDEQDPFMQPVMQFWINVCGDGTNLCWEATPGRLQCVEFVTGAFFLAGEPLPLAGDAETFWSLYQHLSGWQEIPVTTSLPAIGDMMVWRGGGFWSQGQFIEDGHIAIVIQVQPPQNGQDGSITVAEANAPGTRWDQAHAADAGNWYTMTVHPNFAVDTWGPYTDAQGVHHDGFAVLGYIRSLASASS